MHTARSNQFAKIKLALLATSLLMLGLMGCNSEQAKSPRLLLISIDGYRFDYTDKFQPPFLTEFRQQGASLVALRPAFPSKTFPNHLTLVTGMLPAHHGIVGNQFYAPELQKKYSIGNPAAVTNPRFYQAEPLWVLLERASIKTATYFWPGSEAAIGGVYPSSFEKYQHNTPNRERVTKVLDWIGRRDADAPRFMSLYFSTVDSAGHEFGPDSMQTRAAVLSVDKTLAELSLDAARLDPNLNIVIVSDHGMQARVDGQIESLFNTANQQLREHYQIIGDGPLVQFYEKDSATRNIAADIAQLNSTAAHFRCHSATGTPQPLQLRDNPRIGDIICIAHSQWNIATEPNQTFPPGNHGWPPHEAEDMGAIFYARGPAFKRGYVHATQDNVHVMPLLLHIFAVEEPEGLDGKLKAMAPLLSNGANMEK